MEITPILLSLVLISRVRSDGEEDADSPDSCLPKLADRCFTGLMPSLECQMENQGSCSQLGDFCSLATESMQCAADIIDTDCKDGRINFDSWLRGLQSVTRKICGDDAELLRVMTDTPCFNIEEFLDCVEEVAKVTHVLDLLRVSLDTKECNRLMIALPTCNVRAHAAHSMCYLPQEVINDVIYEFFSNTECGYLCAQSSQTDGALSNGSPCLMFFTTVLSSIVVTSIK